jgi:predicted glycosyltransferase
MRVLFNIGHPAQVHLFKNLIWELERQGHQCKITTIAKDVSLYLLDAYKFEYEVVGEGKPTLATKALELLRVESRLYRIACSFRPDLLVGGVGNVYVAHVGKLLRKPSIVFDDTEHAKIDHRLMDPFVNVICTPSCYRGDIGPKQVRYNGYHELAYLHPNRFIPNPAVLTELGLDTDDNIFLVRFAAFDASHDTKTEHFDKRYIPELINRLEDNGTVVISSEVKLEPYLQKYQYKLSPDRYHDLLYFSKMYIGEGSTSAMEAAVLGVPPIHFERLNIGGQKSTILPYIGVLNELQAKYNLLYSFCDERDLLSKVDEILADLNQAKVIWGRRRDALLNDKIDVTAFMVWFIENYPASFNQLKNNPTIGENFKLRLSEVV